MEFLAQLVGRESSVFDNFSRNCWIINQLSHVTWVWRARHRENRNSTKNLGSFGWLLCKGPQYGELFVCVQGEGGSHCPFCHCEKGALSSFHGLVEHCVLDNICEILRSSLCQHSSHSSERHSQHFFVDLSFTGAFVCEKVHNNLAFLTQIKL